MGGKRGHALFDEPGGPAETVIGETAVKGDDNGIGSIIRDLKAGGFKLGDDGTHAQQEELFELRMIVFQIIDAVKCGVVKVFFRDGNTHVVQALHIFADAVTGVVGKKRITDISLFEKRQKRFGAGKEMRPFVNGIIHIQKNLPDFGKVDH